MVTQWSNGAFEMKILITGASGVIGKSLVKMLSKYAENIDATYFSKEFHAESSECKINIIPYSQIFENKKIGIYDQIWHFATYGQPARFIDSWPDVINLNVNDIHHFITLLNPSGNFFYA